MKRTTWYCIDRSCGWQETSHKVRDGLKCPVCELPTNNKLSTIRKETGVKQPERITRKEMVDEINTSYAKSLKELTGKDVPNIMEMW